MKKNKSGSSGSSRSDNVRMGKTQGAASKKQGNMAEKSSSRGKRTGRKSAEDK